MMVSVPRTRLLLANPTGCMRPSRSIFTSKSAIAGRSRRPLELDMFGQFGAGQRLSDRVVADIGDLAQTVEQAERLKDARIDADADAGVPSLDFLQGRAGREGALRYDRHRQPATPAGVVDIGAELAPGAPRSEERRVGKAGGRPCRSGWSPYH